MIETDMTILWAGTLLFLAIIAIYSIFRIRAKNPPELEGKNE